MTSSASQQYHGDKNVLSHLPFSSNIARYGVFGIYNHSQLMKRARKYCVIKFDVKRNQNPAEYRLFRSNMLLKKKYFTCKYFEFLHPYINSEWTP